MKLVIAYIQPEKLTDVKRELYANEIYKMSVTTSLGCGQQKGFHEVYRGVEEEVNLLRKTRIEVGVNAQYVEKVVDALVKGAQTGNIGDGKIFIIPMEECIRIRTGEKGEVAIG